MCMNFYAQMPNVQSMKQPKKGKHRLNSFNARYDDYHYYYYY